MLEPHHRGYRADRTDAGLPGECAGAFTGYAVQQLRLAFAQSL